MEKNSTSLETMAYTGAHIDSAALKHWSAGVVTAQFAGRLGGNQEFIANVESDSARSLLERQADAAPLRNIVASLNVQSVQNADLWRMAFIEGIGTFLLVFLVGGMASGLTTLDQSVLAKTLYGAFTSFLTITTFTFCLAPITGSHLNSAITMTTLFAGLSTLPRALLYICAQTVGAIVAGYWLRLSLGDTYFSDKVIPGCTVDASLVSVGQLFALEFMYSLAFIFVVCGIGLDPRQGKTIGPTLAPFLIGGVVSLGTLTSALARTGYTGVSFNPARCSGLMIAAGEMQYNYVHWLGPLAAAVANGVLYRVAPPWKRETPLLANIL